MVIASIPSFREGALHGEARPPYTINVSVGGQVKHEATGVTMAVTEDGHDLQSWSGSSCG